MGLLVVINQHNAAVQLVIQLVGAVVYCLYIIFQPRSQSSSICKDERLLSTVLWKNITMMMIMNAEYICQVLAHLLDMVFYSDEKERVIPLLVNIMHYVVPYLRNHRWA